MTSQRLLVVSNRLPVNLERRRGQIHYQPSVGGLTRSLEDARQRMEMRWLGWPGLTANNAEERQAIRSRLASEFDCVPLFIPQRQFER